MMLTSAMLAGVLCLGVSALAQADGQGAAAGQTPVPATAQAPAVAASGQASAAAVASAPAATSTIQGVVKASGVPLPGVAVTAVSGESKKYATTTDINGAFRMDVPAGTYQVRTQLMGFATLNKQVVATPADAAVAQQLEFATDLASRMPDQAPANAPATTASNTPAPAATGTANAAKPGAANAGATTAGTPSRTTATASDGTPGAGARRPGGYGGGAGGGAGGARRTVTNQARGTQSLDVQGNEDSDLTDATAGSASADVQVPSIGGIAGGDDIAAASDSIAVTGQQGQINGLAMFSEGDLQGRIREMQAQGLGNGDIAGALTGAMQNGTFGGPNGGPGGGGGFGGGPGGGPGGFGGGGGGGGFRGGGGGGGGRGGGGGGGRFGGPGGFRGQNPNAWHGTVGYTGSNSVLNALSWNPTGIPQAKPQSARNSLVASFTGTPFIPHLLAANPKQFMFLSLSETRNTTPTTVQTNVPTLAQRYGDLTPNSVVPQSGDGNLGQAGNGLLGTVYDPITGNRYVPSASGDPCSSALLALYPTGTAPTACIPASELNTPLARSAQALLAYYPLPNINATQTRYNYQVNLPGSSHQSQVSARFNRSFGAQPTRGRGGFGGGGGGGRGVGGGGGGGQNRNVPLALRQSIAENFAYSHSASASANFIPTLGGHSNTDGYSFSSGYTLGYGRLNNSATLSWNRSTGLATNYFTGVVNPAFQAGILVGNSTIYNDPFYFGLPSVGISGGFRGLSNSAPSNTVNETISFSDNARWNHKRHNVQLGFDFRRIYADSIGGGGVLGSFTFSGFATENPNAQTCDPNIDPQKCTEYAPSGDSMADFLLGLPQNSNVTAGLNKVYLRGNSWDWFAQDDWRARPNVTLQLGMRWEYFSPYSEKYNRLVNLNVTGAGQSLAVSTVCGAAAPAGSPAGSCAALDPGSLVHPDKNLYSPRLSIAWVPRFKFTKNMRVSASYGINYNTGQYASFARNLAYQQPFYVTQKNVLSSGGTNTGCVLPSQVGPGTKALTLADGFNCSTALTQSSYAVNPNYRLGMVQVWNFGIQKTLPQGVVLNIDYTGSNAGNLDMVRAPNRNAYGVIRSTVGQFTYEDSLGYLRSNALLVNVRERMHKGVSLGATYKYSHSIDNASSVGGSGNSIAQDDQNLAAEESNSSFDQRHSLSGNFVIEPPIGPNRAFLNKGGFWSHALDGFNISGAFTFATGGFETPSFSGTAAEIAAGANGLRPNRNPTQAIRGAQTHLQWFNPAAFVGLCDPSNPQPYCLQAGQYGTATRNSIGLPGTVSLNAALSRSISFGETRSLEMRLTAQNPFNTVQYSGIDSQVNSQTFGEVTSAAGMRAFTYNLRYRF
jgi:trimeric autotransporter adhesin